MEEKLKLLVVDDELDNLDLLYRTFRQDFQVFRADGGKAALDLLTQVGEVAIIISDQRMPQMNGTEFLGRTVEGFPDTIRILLTGHTDVKDLVSAINSGKVFKYITKPWNPKKLKEIVAQAAETYRVIKRRTDELSRALKQQSLINDIMTAVRGSLDYGSTLQAVVSTLGQAFNVDLAILYPVETSPGASDSQPLLVYRLLQEDAQPEGESEDDFTLELEALPPLRSPSAIFSEVIEIAGNPVTRIVVPS